VEAGGVAGGEVSRGFRDWRGELVAAAREGEDVVGAVAERFAEGEDVLGKVALFDEGVGPDGLEEVGFGDGLAGVGDEAGLP
jgi:hypothetical protein